MQLIDFKMLIMTYTYEITIKDIKLVCTYPSLEPEFFSTCNGVSFLGRSTIVERSGGGVVDNTLDYQSRGRKIDPPLLRSFG